MFEQEFMSIQSSIISLCVEFSQGKADHIFAYIYTKEDQYYFNAFFRIGKETWDIIDLEYPIEVVQEFQSLILSEVDKMRILFKENKREMPIEQKLKFQLKSQKFKFDLKYPKEIKHSDPRSAFGKWKQSIKKKRILLFT